MKRWNTAAMRLSQGEFVAATVHEISAKPKRREIRPD
jgi:hypothetical protein